MHHLRSLGRNLNRKINIPKVRLYCHYHQQQTGVGCWGCLPGPVLVLSVLLPLTASNRSGVLDPVIQTLGWGLEVLKRTMAQLDAHAAKVNRGQAELDGRGWLSVFERRRAIKMRERDEDGDVGGEGTVEASCPELRRLFNLKVMGQNQ